MSRKKERKAVAARAPEVREAAPGPNPSVLKDALAGFFLLATTLLAYLPVWHAGMIWDDDGHVTRPDLRSLHGLWRIWFEPGATQQYYPFLHSAFWAEHQLWGDSAPGYHVANVVLHAAVAWLLYHLLRRLSLPGALFAALLFALHPVCVESVAWISEQKNTLSAIFYLAAALAYLRFDKGRRLAPYILALVLFAVALATKTVTCTLPAALLVLFWWKRGRISWKGDVVPLVPFFALGGAAGLVTAWVEKTYIGATGASFGLGVADRVLVAGRAILFYLSKLFWPTDLAFIYPRWTLDDRAAWQYLFPAAVLIALAILFALRGRARGPLAAALIFAGTLFPALGFINVYPFIYSFVADHFQYLAAAAMISACTAAVAGFAGPLAQRGRLAAAAAASCLAAGLGWLTYQQCATYADPETLWRTTISRNPECWMAYENLGGVLMGQGHVDLAKEQFRRALDINPDDTEAMNELGVATMQQGNAAEAIALYLRALDIDPNSAETQINLGVALLQKGLPEKAANHFQHAAQIEPNNAKAHKDLAAAYLQESQWADAVVQFQRAVEIEPGNAETRYLLGSALTRAGRLDEAMAQYRKVLEIDEDHSRAHADLATGLIREGKADEAIAHLRRAIEINPNFAEAHNNLANVLFGKGNTNEAITQFQTAIGIDDRYADAHFNLGNTLLEAGRTAEAVAQFRATIAIKPDFGDAHDNLANALIMEGHMEEAAGELGTTLALEPGNAEAHNELGAVLARGGKADEAIAQYGMAIAIKPDYATALMNRGNSFLQAGRLLEAIGDYTKALAADPKNARLRNNLGIALIKAGRSQEAAAQFQKALDIDPGYEDARRNLASALREAPAK
jgi:tetratricopeptide (TPR) repeat protein